MKVLSTFSGISAASVAWKPLGFEFVGYCEPEPLPCHVLNARLDATAPIYLPDGFRRSNYRHVKGGSIPNFGDIEQISDRDLRALGPVDVLEGGSPCQDFSVAGLRMGLKGERGNLTLEFLRLAMRMRKINNLKYVVWENVDGVRSDETNAFGKLLSALVGGPERGVVASGRGWSQGWTSAGHAAGPDGEVAWRIMDAQGWGVPQRRRRVFVVGRLGAGPVCPGEVLFDPRGEGWGAEPGGEACRDAWEGPAGDAGGGAAGGLGPIAFMAGQGAKAGSVAASVDFSPTLRSAESGSNRTPCVAYFDRHGVDRYGDAGTQASTLRACESAAYETDLVVYPDTRKSIVRRLTPLECERLQGFPELWTEVGYKGKNRPPDAPRYRALGNSMAVPCMSHIGRGLLREDAAAREAALAA